MAGRPGWETVARQPVDAVLCAAHGVEQDRHAEQIEDLVSHLEERVRS